MIRTTLLVLILSLTACTSPGAGDCPVDLGMMAPLMTELHLAESLSTEVPALLKDSIKEVHFKKILEDHQLDQERFDSLLWIIRQEPIWVDSLYTRIGVALARIEAEM